MMTLKCPHCGKEFTANDDEYAAIVNQIKNAAFNEEAAKAFANPDEQ